MQSVSMTKIDQFFHRKDSLTTKDKEILPTRCSDSKESVHSSYQDELEDESDSENFNKYCVSHL